MRDTISKKNLLVLLFEVLLRLSHREIIVLTAGEFRTRHLFSWGLIKSLATVVAFSAQSERSSGCRSRMRYPVLWKKTGRTSFQIIRYFQEKTLCVQIIASSLILKSTKFINRDICSSWLPVKFYKNMCLIAHIPPSPKSHIYWLSLLALQISFSELSERLSLGL